MAVDFNSYVATYQEQIRQSQSFARVHQAVYLQIKANALKRLVQERFGDTRTARVLDVGCGMGLMETHLDGAFAELVGVDPASQAIEYAQRSAVCARFASYDGRCLPFPDRQFDVAFAVCVMHHVPPPQWPQFLAEIERVLRPGGMVVIFEHNPFNPLTRLAVARCAFDRDAVLLPGRNTVQLLEASGLVHVRRRYLLFLPWEGRVWSAAERMLGWLPLGAQYYVAGFKREAGVAAIREPHAGACAKDERHRATTSVP